MQKEVVVDLKDNKPLFEHYTKKQDYINAGVKWVEPMTAKEPLNEEQLEDMLTSPQYIAEEKFDGTRATMHFYSKYECSKCGFKSDLDLFEDTEFDGDVWGTCPECKENCMLLMTQGYTRLFSRRVSVKTDWFAENTDLLPHLRDIDEPFLEGTVLDGELFMIGYPFIDASSTLNCNWDKAIERQIGKTFITFHAFDIVYHKGEYVAEKPLHERKKLLEDVVGIINNEYVTAVDYFEKEIIKFITDEEIGQIAVNNEKYPELFTCVTHGRVHDYLYTLNKKAYYEYVVFSGGEGIMLKDKNGKYLHKRSREYTKMKKFLTRECIILGFSPPTREYEGKGKGDPKAVWEYWYAESTTIVQKMTMQEAEKYGLIPVSKNFAMNWVGNMKFGVLITEEELAALKKINSKGKYITYDPRKYGFNIGNSSNNLLHILLLGECSGYDEKTREKFTKNQDNMIGQVVEIKGEEVISKTGAIRHPRFLRLRQDKNASDCTWKDHIG